MIKHIVLFKLEKYDRAVCEKAKELMLAMKERIPEVMQVEVRLDQLRSARSYDIMLAVTVPDWQALDEYQFDVYHCGVVKKFIFPVSKAVATIDYEY